MNDMDTSPLREKWGDALGGGWVVLPNVLFRYQQYLGLDCEEMVLVSNLFASWWEVEKLPFPRTSTLAKRTGLSVRTVQRRLHSLEARGLLKRVLVGVGGNEPREVTAYDLSGLVKKLQILGAMQGEVIQEAKISGVTPA